MIVNTYSTACGNYYMGGCQGVNAHLLLIGQHSPNDFLHIYLAQFGWSGGLTDIQGQPLAYNRKDCNGGDIGERQLGMPRRNGGNAKLQWLKNVGGEHLLSCKDIDHHIKFIGYVIRYLMNPKSTAAWYSASQSSAPFNVEFHSYQPFLAVLHGSFSAFSTIFLPYP